VIDDFDFEVLDQGAEGDRAATRFAVTGVNRARRLRLDGITLSRPRDGRMVEDWSAIDKLELVRQLGLGRTLLAAPACCARFAIRSSAALCSPDRGSHRAELGSLAAGVLEL
jgi:hypothetical protein